MNIILSYLVRRTFMFYLFSCSVVAFYDHDCHVNVLSSYDDMMYDGYCAYWFTIHYTTVVLTLFLSNTSSRRRIDDKYRDLSHIV